MVRKVSAKILLGLVIGAVLYWPSVASATAAPSIESPGNGQTLGSPSFNVHVTATGQCGISRAKLLLEGTGISGSKEVWSTGPDARSKTSLDEAFTFNILTYSKVNGSFQFTLFVREWVNGTLNCSEASNWAPQTHSIGFQMDVAPATPSWSSGYPAVKIVDGAPEITAKWKANSEPDLTMYEITRSGSGADFVDDLTPGAVCRSGTCTYVDKQFAGTGYSGTYSYSIRAFRNNSSGSDTLSSPASTRSASVKEPAPPPPPNNGGSGGSGTGGSSNGGATGGSSNSGGGISQNGGAPDPAAQGLSQNGGASAPVTPGQSLPGGGGNSSDFFTGEYSPRLPYQSRHLLVPGSGGTRTTSRTVASGPTYGDSINAMKMLIPIAGGLLFITLAAHARRMLRDK
jgi:hypothetical protein